MTCYYILTCCDDDEARVVLYCFAHWLACDDDERIVIVGCLQTCHLGPFIDSLALTLTFIVTATTTHQDLYYLSPGIIHISVTSCYHDVMGCRTFHWAGMDH
jgi:hypothetical protein